LAKAKWEVIQEIEEKLDFAPFTKEWDIYYSRKDAFTFGPSTLEQIIPGAIFIATLIYILYISFNHLCS
jgi:hypothetical protein